MNNGKNEVKHLKRIKGLKYLAKISVLSAMATVLMLFEFPLWFAPGFYKLDLSDLPIMIGGFALGPWATVIMELAKNLLHLLIKGTSTAYVGEFANFVTSCALVLPAALIYKYHKSFKSALLGMLLGISIFAVFGSIFNYYVLIPAFAKLYGTSLDQIIGMGTAVNSHIKSLKTLVMFAVLPFNLLKGFLCSALTIPIYKRVSGILHK